MNRNTCLQVGILTLVVGSAGPLIWSAPAYSETEGMDRRDERQADRQQGRDMKQEGRDAARELKDQCKEAGGSGPECRQEKRGAKQETREGARELKTTE